MFFMLKVFCCLVLSMFMVGCIQKEVFVFPKEGIEISKVLSSFRVGFSMIEKNDKLYMAYYDSLHQMTLATCDLKSGKLEYKTLPSKIEWDSHNYITMTFDKEGYLHLSGNMHAIPLIYFRSEFPYDIHSMCQVEKMTGIDESCITYPSFMESPDSNLIFHYRSGESGNGSEIYNIYDVKTKSWRRLLDTPLIYGDGKRNAYMQGPVLGGDGYYHLIWVWRETPDCSTNHTLSYARSKDLLNWENIAGIKTQLPIILENEEFWVDATPVKGGLFNPGIKLGFDSKNHPIIGYHKFDENGYNQLYVAKYIDDEWKLSKLTDWEYRWQFEGIGSMKTELSITNPVSIKDGIMAFGYNHIKEGKGEILFDENTLKSCNKREPISLYPKSYDDVISSFPGMHVRTIVEGDYLLRWETLDANRDRKPEGELPPASSLILYKFK